MWQDLTQNLQSELRAFRNALSFAPPWAVSFVLLVSAVAVAWLLHAAILVLMRRILRGRRPYLLSMLNATKNPARFGLLLFALAITLPTTTLGPETRTVLAQCLLLATVFLLGWIATAALEIAATIYLRKFRLDVEDNLLARKHITQIRVLVRVLDTISRGRDAHYSAPPAQNRTCGFPAYGSHLGCLTAKRCLGQGWRMSGLGEPVVGELRPSVAQVVRSLWLRRRSARRQSSMTW